MSSRALRKIQRMREEEGTKGGGPELDELNEEAGDSDDNSEAPSAGTGRPAFNAFDLLNAGGDNEDGDEEEEEEEEEEEIRGGDNEAPESPQPQPSTVSDAPDISVPSTEASQASERKKQKNKQKKKGKKGKGKNKEATADEQTPTTATQYDISISKAEKTTKKTKGKNGNVDEIDEALQELSLRTGSQSATSGSGAAGGDGASNGASDSPDSESLCRLLSIETRNLDSLNEMRKLFGNIVLRERESSSPPPPRVTRRNRRGGRIQLDLGSALAGRYSPASRGQELSGIGLRRNVLMQGKDEWPRAPSGGLGMELVERPGQQQKPGTRVGGVREYKLVHNAAYTDTQRQFEICVESMQPENLIQHLQLNPYHLSTLLQVSEVAKHQGDHSVSSDLLERAIFNIGRSVHSSFPNYLKEGKARMSFAVKENREVWLTVWRYIMSLERKGTWSTVYEWAKFLLSLDPADPYWISLIVDNAAIRGRRASHFVDLCSHPYYKKRWANHPNIQCTLALAYRMLGDTERCNEQLQKAMSLYPWVFCRLASELNIDPVPKKIWGYQPPDVPHELYTELYITRAKDLWNIPEAVSLIKEFGRTIEVHSPTSQAPDISLDVARHVILSEIRPALSFIPRHFLSGQISSSDPFPPGYDSSTSATEQGRLPSLVERLYGALNWQNRFNDGDNSDADTDDNIDAYGDDDTEAIINEALDRPPGAHNDPSGQNPILEEYLDEDPDALTEEWLLGRGLRDLSEFIRDNGVDPGNWAQDVDVEPLESWVNRLSEIEPERWGIVIEMAADRLGSPMVMDMLTNELELQTMQ